jgi:hypothetical protein
MISIMVLDPLRGGRWWQSNLSIHRIQRGDKVHTLSHTLQILVLSRSRDASVTGRASSLL